MKPAVVRFYVDADLLGLAKILAGLNAEITYPGDPGAVVHKRRRPGCDIEPGAKDVEWLPIVAGQGWLTITRDARIHQHRAEIDAVLEHGGKLVALAGEDADRKWTQLEVVMSQWRAIEKLADLPGPFLFAAHRTSLRQVAP